MNVEQRYYIQEQAPAGNYNDAVGLSTTATQADAEKRLEEYKHSFPEEKCRLVLRITVPIKS